VAQITIDRDRQLYYARIDGDAHAPCLVFLHEGLGCTAMWHDFPERLCRLTGCPGLIYDRWGFGRSSRANVPRTIHYLHEDALYELPRVLSALIPERPFVMVGHSDGGSIALLYGAERSRHLCGIITEAAHVFVEPITLDGIRATVKAYAKGKLAGLAKYHGEKTNAVFRAWADIWLSDWFYGWNIEYILPAVTAPLLVMQGKDDQYATERQVEAIVSQAGCAATASLVEDCGHTPHLDRPDEALSRMAAFIEQVSRAA
jgi:pimeloyl-ACP methyl ester carboxylesterase